MSSWKALLASVTNSAHKRLRLTQEEWDKHTRQTIKMNTSLVERAKKAKQPLTFSPTELDTMNVLRLALRVFGQEPLTEDTVHAHLYTEFKSMFTDPRVGAVINRWKELDPTANNVKSTLSEFRRTFAQCVQARTES